MTKAADKGFDHYAGLIDRAAADASAEAIASDLARQDWSLVLISRIAPEPVVIAHSKDVHGVPAGYAVYTAAELEHLAAEEHSAHTMALIHAAKKMGAVLITEGN